MQSMFDIMGSKDFGVPPEVVEIKTYVLRHFDTDVAVTMQTSVIIITVSSASLAGALRPHLHKLQKQLNSNKKLIIRIG
jgi:ribosome-associated translation inhibitor RaiA